MVKLKVINFYELLFFNETCMRNVFLSNEHEIFMETPGGFEEEIFAEYLWAVSFKYIEKPKYMNLSEIDSD